MPYAVWKKSAQQSPNKLKRKTHETFAQRDSFATVGFLLSVYSQTYIHAQHSTAQHSDTQTHRQLAMQRWCAVEKRYLTPIYRRFYRQTINSHTWILPNHRLKNSIHRVASVLRPLRPNASNLHAQGKLRREYVFFQRSSVTILQKCM